MHFITYMINVHELTDLVITCSGKKNSLLIIWLEACHNLGHNTLVCFVDIIETEHELP